MGIDLKRLYYGATAFLVFVVAFFAAQTLSDAAWHLILLSGVPMEERRVMPVVPFAPPPPTAALAVAPGEPTPAPRPTLSPEQWDELQRKERARSEDFELQGAKESVASSLAILLVALPIWYFHWRRWRALTETQSPQLFRLYVYALMLITLMAAVLRGGYAVGRIISWWLGVVDVSSRYTAMTFAQGLGGSIVGALLALLAWFYHWHSVERVPGDE